MSAEVIVRGLLLVIGFTVALVILAAVAVAAPEIAQPIVAIGHLVIAVAGSVICVAVIVWAVVEDPAWGLRDAIRLVALTIFVVLAIGLFLTLMIARRT